MQLASLIGHTQEVLGLIRESDKPADSIIESFFRSRKYLGSHDRRFIAETTYGTLRHLRFCGTLVKQATENKSISKSDGFLLLVAAYLIGVEKRKDIGEAVLLPKIHNASVRNNLGGIIHNLQSSNGVEGGSDVERLAGQYSFQDWMVEKFVSRFGSPEAERLCKSLNVQAPLTIRVNTLKADIESCRKHLQQEGVETELVAQVPDALVLKKRVNVFALESFKAGMFEVQDAGSQLLPLLVDPKPTFRVLDACAGAGGKSLQFAAIMKNRGEIVAADVNKYRLEELRRRARRADVHNIRTVEVKSLDELAKSYAGYFDVVFVDAPCTGIGTIRRNPGMKWTVTPEAVGELSTKQKQILESCAPLVKPGGRLVYATCSLLKEENEDVVEGFMKQHKDFSFSPLTRQDGSSVSYLLPHRDGTDGFFVFAMERAG